jgi:hypothetical protein
MKQNSHQSKILHEKEQYSRRTSSSWPVSRLFSSSSARKFLHTFYKSLTTGWARRSKDKSPNCCKEDEPKCKHFDSPSGATDWQIYELHKLEISDLHGFWSRKARRRKKPGRIQAHSSSSSKETAASGGQPQEQRLRLPSPANLRYARGRRREAEYGIGRDPLGWPRSLRWMI